MTDIHNPYTLTLKVRDYECDMEGIVNNAVYLNYLEHARHEFLKTVGVDFAELTRRGIHPVVIRAEVDYIAPLRSGDRFRIDVRVERVSRLRVAFVQQIRRLSGAPEVTDGANPQTAAPDGGDRTVEARIIAAVISASGRPLPPEELGTQFAELFG